ncbi:N-6 DNA Methylase family [endosymbiont GvMRE of Glomus versiforme]|nr:N-6 DNA Methylase family [endosymbiont GvMRE of Glomus versiforme]
MEHWALKDLRVDLTREEHENYWIYPQGNTHDPLVRKILERCDGKPKYCPLSEFLIETKIGKGKPEYIFRIKKRPIILLVECKTENANHQSEKLDKPAFYNVDGLLYYAKYFKDDFTVLGLAITGRERNNCQISFFTWLQEEKNFNPKNIQKHERLRSIEEYFPVESKPSLDIKMVRKSAKELHEIIYQGLGFTEKEKPLFISACLIALKNEDFRNEFSTKTTPRSLVSACKGAIESEIEKVQEKEVGKKYEDLKSSLKRIIGNNEKLSSTSNNKKNSFVNILRTIKNDIWSFIDKGDIIGEFYHEFLKYSTGDGKNLGIVLTPPHIADLFCELSLKELGQEKFAKEDKFLDVCCGTGSFLVSALNKGADRNNIYGIEINQDVSNLALTNMILWGDGKSHIFRKDCFDKESKNLIKEANCNIAFLNPPYSQKKQKEGEGKSEIEFIELSCDLLKKGGLVIAIIPLSVAIGTKYKTERERIMKKHTLKAVMTMPSDLFSGNNSGSHTCVMIWKTGESHNKETYSTWLSNWKDDGFVILKGKRFDKDNKWKDIKKQWIKDFCQKKDKYNSVFRGLDYKDCWLADAWVETDYRQLTEKHFEKTIRDYLAFRISVIEEEKNPINKNE